MWRVPDFFLKKKDAKVSVVWNGWRKTKFFLTSPKEKDKMRNGSLKLSRESSDVCRMYVNMCINHCISWCKTL